MTTQNNIQMFGDWPFPTATNEPGEKKLEKGFSIFMELYAIFMELYAIFMVLYAILMALHYVCNIQLAIFNFPICFDSKSVLYALQNWDCKMRGDILKHCITSRGIGIEFCWVPSLLE